MKYKVLVDDNFHYTDEDERYELGEFDTEEDAIAACKKIVDECLRGPHEPGMTSKEFFQGYIRFGEDPFIVPPVEPHFSAWDYARARCMEICREEDAAASVLRYPAWPTELAGFGAVLLAAFGRKGLGAAERQALEAFRRAIEDYPNAMPCEVRWYWLRLEHKNVAFTIYLHSDRFKLYAEGIQLVSVQWELRFWGSGQRDLREGDIAAAFEAMRQAALDPAFALKTSV